MTESANEDTARLEGVKSKKCNDDPPVDSISIPIEPDREISREPRVQKTCPWPEGTRISVGNCVIEPLRIIFWSDGRARFESRVATSSFGSGDVWVFYGGISLRDFNGATLWTSEKVVGPEMPGPGFQDWNHGFAFPVVFFDHINTARLNQMHC
ncbi:hypothetical protein SRB5_46240 [Streptomyces sp. RB5]|uniref:DUF6294 domain-containing protein n=1 Tax=Streptomyces smaragdinus TaxID=2585196 RepID=A0A7K0CLU9_9ACTN|nr:DUF6294 family protein [Streptomyces smaragdinus]MQY14457.1 hypothetical protein [Streptomyces smaragdinus]